MRLCSLSRIDESILVGLSLRLLHRFLIFSEICLFMKFLSSIRHVCFNRFVKSFVALIISFRFVGLNGTKLGNVKLCEDVMDLIDRNVLYHLECDGVVFLKECNEDNRCAILQ